MFPDYPFLMKRIICADEKLKRKLFDKEEKNSYTRFFYKQLVYKQTYSIYKMIKQLQ